MSALIPTTGTKIVTFVCVSSGVDEATHNSDSLLRLYVAHSCARQRAVTKQPPQDRLLDRRTTCEVRRFPRGKRMRARPQVMASVVLRGWREWYSAPMLSSWRTEMGAFGSSSEYTTLRHYASQSQLPTIFEIKLPVATALMPTHTRVDVPPDQLTLTTPPSCGAVMFRINDHQSLGL